MTQEEVAQEDRQIYDPGFPAGAPRFRPLSAPRAYQGRSYVRASTGGQVRKSQQNEQETQQQTAERADRPTRCASAPEKAFTYNIIPNRQWKGEENQPVTSTIVSSEAAPRIGTCLARKVCRHSLFVALTAVSVGRLLLC